MLHFLPAVIALVLTIFFVRFLRAERGKNANKEN
jgi:hypothetical protein